MKFHGLWDFAILGDYVTLSLKSSVAGVLKTKPSLNWPALCGDINIQQQTGVKHVFTVLSHSAFYARNILIDVVILTQLSERIELQTPEQASGSWQKKEGFSSSNPK